MVLCIEIINRISFLKIDRIAGLQDFIEIAGLTDYLQYKFGNIHKYSQELKSLIHKTYVS